MRRKPKSKQTKGINQELNDIERADENELKRSRSRKAVGHKSKSRYHGNNDPSWYALSPQLLKDAGSLSFNNPIGVSMPDVLVDTRGLTNNYFIPGVFAFRYNTAIGRSVNNSSAINIAARRLYTFVRHANSGSANYDSPDLMLYILAAQSCYNTYAQLVRAYGVANVYAQANRYLPDALLAAAGFNPEDVRHNLANFRYGINVLAAKLNSLAIPKTFNLFKRAMWLTSSIFKDAPTIKSQTIIPRPLRYYLYNETESASGVPGFLQEYSYPNSNQGTVEKWLELANKQIAKLIESEDIGIMAGDILKAYGNTNLYQVSGITEGFIILPTYDQEFLLQLHNADFMRVADVSATGEQPYDIKQDQNGAIIFDPHVTVGSTIYSDNYNKGMYRYIKQALDARRLLDIRVESPTPEEVFLATRFKIAGAAEPNDAQRSFGVKYFCTEIPHSLLAYSYSIKDGRWELQTTPIYGINFGDIAGDVELLSRLDWAPYLYAAQINMMGDAFSFATTTGIIGDVDNVTSIDGVTLDKIHQAALLSMFDIPSMSGFSA